MRLDRRAFSLIEVLCAIAVFSVFSVISILSLRQVGRVWQRASAKDMALRELLRVEAQLHRDLANAARTAPQSAFGPVRAGAGAMVTGDGLALIVPPDDQTELNLNSQGAPVLDRLVTYYLAVPANVNSLSGLSHTFLADPDGYEDACGYKWLIRKEEAAPAPGSPGGLPAVPANWLAGPVIEVPTSFWRAPDRRVVASNLLQFRVRQGPPTWEITATAVALGDARRRIALGGVLLSTTPYSLTQRIGIVAKN